MPYRSTTCRFGRGTGAGMQQAHTGTFVLFRVIAEPMAVVGSTVHAWQWMTYMLDGGRRIKGSIKLAHVSNMIYVCMKIRRSCIQYEVTVCTAVQFLMEDSQTSATKERISVFACRGWTHGGGGPNRDARNITSPGERRTGVVGGGVGRYNTIKQVAFLSGLPHGRTHRHGGLKIWQRSQGAGERQEVGEGR